MKTKKETKQPVPKKIGTNGIVKKKKKVKVSPQELSNCSENESVAAVTSVSQKNKKVKKRNKDKKSNLQKPAGNDLSTSMKVKEAENGTNTVQDANVNGGSSLNKTQKKKQVNSQTPTANSNAHSNAKSQKNLKKRMAKKNKKAKAELNGITETNEQKEKRTIFVGNVSTKTTRKQLTQFFSKYGKVESVRLRCAAVPGPSTTKREAVIMKNFHEKRSSLVAYVRFTEPVMVEEALKANGSELDQKHIHVDRSQSTANKNSKQAVFIGNLAFEAEEEALRSHFADCGEIESVRIIRDKKMASGKGFGYVNFMSEDAVEIALKLDGQVFMHRQLRVQRCTKLGNKKPKPSFKTRGKKGLAFMKGDSNSVQRPKKQQMFSGKKMMETKTFKKMKAKSKYTKEDRKKKAIAHKLAGKMPRKTMP